MVVIKGVPRITGHDNPLTKINGVDIQNPWLHTFAFVDLYLILSFDPFAALSLSEVFS